MAINLERLSRVLHFLFNHVKELELSYNCAKLQVKTWTDFSLQSFEIYGYTLFEMRKPLVYKFFFTLKLWPDKVFNTFNSSGRNQEIWKYLLQIWKTQKAIVMNYNLFQNTSCLGDASSF